MENLTQFLKSNLSGGGLNREGDYLKLGSEGKGLLQNYRGLNSAFIVYILINIVMRSFLFLNLSIILNLFEWQNITCIHKCMVSQAIVPTVNVIV